MKRDRRVRMGIAGLGRMGRYHAENLAGRAPGVELVRVVDAVEETARSTGERLGVDWSTSFDHLLSDPDIDAVVIVTPTPTHAAMIEQAARAGKHVFCEKPISFELQPTLRAIETARDAGVKLQIGFHRRFDPDWSAAVDRIRQGELGEVFLFRTSLRDMRPPSMEYIRSSGGFFVDVTIHDLDTARWMVGEVDEVTAFGAALSDPAFAEVGDIDNALVVLHFGSGALGVIDNSRVAGYGYECSTEVMGSRATVRIGDHRRAHLQWLTPGSQSVDHVADFTERYPEAYLRELEDFAAAVRDDRPVAATGEDALAAFVLCRAADLSLRQGRSVKLQHEERDGRVIYQLADAT
ncbi:MAG: inositol 2-dehydrogenase [Actinomycetota bacterium]|nr:inositol 2-dehydrogenase [Actinomycetota bacterium]